MQQIKVKELPDKYFVTGTYYQSGNTQFAKEKYRNTPTYSGLLGTKHIQLVAVNPRIESEGREHHTFTYFWCDELQNKPGLKEFAQKAYDLQEQGKDIFIYEVSEENNG